MDQPQEYHYRRDASSAGDKAAGSSSGTTDEAAAHFDIIGRTRQRRSHHAVFVTFDVSRVPSAPRDIAVSQIKVKFIARHMQVRETVYFVLSHNPTR